MGHQHCWQSEPPEGKLSWNKSFDQRYGDEEDLAANAMFNSPEEIQRLRLLLKKVWRLLQAGHIWWSGVRPAPQPGQ